MAVVAPRRATGFLGSPKPEIQPKVEAPMLKALVASSGICVSCSGTGDAWHPIKSAFPEKCEECNGAGKK
jgi:hypothetical protein